MNSVQIRHAVRALILSDTNEVLFLRMAHPTRGGEFWLLPGGGVRSNEAAVDALKREVWEETGLGRNGFRSVRFT